MMNAFEVDQCERVACQPIGDEGSSGRFRARSLGKKFASYNTESHTWISTIVAFRDPWTPDPHLQRQWNLDGNLEQHAMRAKDKNLDGFTSVRFDIQDKLFKIHRAPHARFQNSGFSPMILLCRITIHESYR